MAGKRDKRVAAKTKNQKISDYLGNVIIQNLGYSWENDWCAVHGGSKATTYGQYEMQTLHGRDGKFWVQVLGSVNTGHINVGTNGKTQPDEKDIMQALKDALLRA